MFLNVELFSVTLVIIMALELWYIFKDYIIKSHNFMRDVLAPDLKFDML